MIVRKMCPYKQSPRHFIDVDTVMDNIDCPVCGKPIFISHCLSLHPYGTRKTSGISLHVCREDRKFKERVLDFVRGHNLEYNIHQLSKVFGCSHGKLWYILHDMEEIEIQKQGRLCIVGVRD